MFPTDFLCYKMLRSRPTKQLSISVSSFLSLLQMAAAHQYRKITARPREEEEEEWEAGEPRENSWEFGDRKREGLHSNRLGEYEISAACTNAMPAEKDRAI